MENKRKKQSVLMAAVVSAVLFLLVMLIQNARWVSPAWGETRPAWSGIHVAVAERPASAGPAVSGESAG
ncbi:MAG: hypothetical protein ACE15F_12050 [bacterium]